MIIFLNILFQKTALHIAIKNKNLEIVELLLSHPNIDVKKPKIFQLHFSYNLGKCNFSPEN